MFVRCACGINIGSIFDWPPAEIEEGNKKMFERHLNCACGREMVVRTAPKEEPDSQENADKKQIFSFDEIARRMWSEQDPNDPALKSLTIPSTDQMIKALEATGDPRTAAIIADIQAAQTPTIGLLSAETDLLQSLIRNYAICFKPIYKQPKKEKGEKQGEQINEQAMEQAKEHQLYIEFADKIHDGLVTFAPVEARMVRCAFTERNIFRLYPTTDTDLDTDYNVVMTKKVEELKTKIFGMFEIEGL